MEEIGLSARFCLSFDTPSFQKKVYKSTKNILSNVSFEFWIVAVGDFELFNFELWFNNSKFKTQKLKIGLPTIQNSKLKIQNSKSDNSKFKTQNSKLKL